MPLGLLQKRSSMEKETGRNGLVTFFSLDQTRHFCYSIVTALMKSFCFMISLSFSVYLPC